MYSSSAEHSNHEYNPDTAMEGRAALWTLLVVFIVFKVATTTMILIMDPNGARQILGLFVAMHWPFILGGVTLLAASVTVSVVFRVRLLRVRARRRLLQAAEWRMD